jgi:hypothetical protein
MKKENSVRMRDFIARRDRGEEVAEFLGTQYITVHPFADDTSLLKRLSWLPEQCVAVDAYWLALDDVVFVQVGSSAQNDAMPVGRYIRWNPISHYANLVSVLSEEAVTRINFERELKVFLEQGIAARAIRDGEKLGPRLVRV